MLGLIIIFGNNVGLVLDLNVKYLYVHTLGRESMLRVLTNKIVNANWFCGEEY